MRLVRVETGGGQYAVRIQAGLLERAGAGIREALGARKLFVVADETVWDRLGERLARGLGYLRALAAPDFLQEFKGYDLYRAYYRRCRADARLTRREPARQLLYLWLHSLFVNYHLAADRLDMAHGVEVRLPFLDHRLFEYANSLPLGLLAAGPQEKRLLRKAVQPYVPPSLYARTKRPCCAPPSSGFAANPLHDFVQDTLRGAAMRSVPFVDPAAVVAFLDKLPALPDADRPAADSLLLMLASAAVLQESCGL